MTETFHGYIETTQDVLLIFEGCKRGLLPRVCRRLQDKERGMIRSGSVFVFDERESGIKRWTDGLVWSPSRILGNFLIYRELDKKANDKKASTLAHDLRQRSFSADQTAGTDRSRRLVGSLSDSYHFRKDGLIKKTISVIINGSPQHLISYYHPEDIVANILRTPSSVPELASLEISSDLLVKQNFRVPPTVEPSFDQPENNALMNQFDDRRAHSYRSMSLGSLNNPNIITGNIYTPSPTGNNTAFRKSSNSFYPLYGSSQPSPSSISSSPMLSPVHQSFPRNYSISSTSSSSMHRLAARNSFDLSLQNERQMDLFLPGNEKESRSDHSPNIGQLLNPIHPLNKHEEMLQSMTLDNKYPNYSVPSDNSYDRYSYYQRQDPTNNINLFRNGMVLPNSSIYDQVHLVSE